MAAKNLYLMKDELKKFGIDVTDDMSKDEIIKKFKELPIQEGQIRQLKMYNITYDPALGWSRGYASNFIRETEKYIQLRNELPASPEQRFLMMKLGIPIPKGLRCGEAAEIIASQPAQDYQLAYIKKYGLKYDTERPMTFGYAQILIKNREVWYKNFRLAKKD